MPVANCLFLLLFSYDDEVDKVNQYQRLSLDDLEKIEIGKSCVCQTWNWQKLLFVTGLGRAFPPLCGSVGVPPDFHPFFFQVPRSSVVLLFLFSLSLLCPAPSFSVLSLASFAICCCIVMFFSGSGPEPTFFGKPKFSCMRLHYRHKGISGYFHTLRAVARSPEEDGKGKSQLFWVLHKTARKRRRGRAHV